MSAVAKPAVEPSNFDAFLNAMLQASKHETCTETEQALHAIPQTMIEGAMDEIKTLTDPQKARQIQLKLDDILRLTSRCPQIHDAFVNRLSRLLLMTQVSGSANHQNERKKSIEHLKQFAQQSFEAIILSDCTQSAQNLKHVSTELCHKALLAFQKVERASLNENEQKQIADKLEQVMLYGQKCPAFEEQYRRCLYGEQRSDNYLPLSQIEPFLTWLDGLKNLLSTHPCQGIAKAIAEYNPEQTTAAKRVLSDIKPAQFSPQDRATIKSKMKAVYQTLPNCPEAREGIDSAIESMF